MLPYPTNGDNDVLMKKVTGKQILCRTGGQTIEVAERHGQSGERREVLRGIRERDKKRVGETEGVRERERCRGKERY